MDQLSRKKVTLNKKEIEGYVISQTSIKTLIWVPTDEKWEYFYLFDFTTEKKGFKWETTATSICGPIAKEEFQIKLQDDEAV